MFSRILNLDSSGQFHEEVELWFHDSCGQLHEEVELWFHEFLTSTVVVSFTLWPLEPGGNKTH
jgi:hypothetical protein